MKKCNTILILILSIVIAIITSSCFVLVLNVIKNKNVHTSATLTILEKKMKDKDNATKFAARILEIKEIQESINNHLVDPEKIDKFANYLEEVGTGVGSELIIKGIEVPKLTTNTLNFSISISGTFSQVMKTIALLENIPYQINISKVYLNKDITPTDPEGNKKKNFGVKTWQADVSFNILSTK